MELSDLLAREGYQPKDVPSLLSWARARADALLRGLDPDSSVGALLEGLSRHVPKASSQDDHPPEDSFADEPAEDLRSAVTAATTPEPVPPPPVVDDDPDSGFGGFARFQSLLRMNRPYPVRQQEPPAEERSALARNFVMAAERVTDVAPVVPPPSPPPPAAEFSNTLPLAAISFNSEESGSLVLGIPDEDSVENSGLAGLSDLFDPDAGPDIVESPPPAPVAPQPTRASGPIRSVAYIDDDDELPLPPPPPPASSSLPPPPTIASPVDVEETIAAPLRSRDTNPGLAAIETHHETHHDSAAPVLRHRGPKKKVVELGAPVGRPRSGSAGSAPPAPRGPIAAKPAAKKPPPPPPAAKKPLPIDDDIQELSRVELIDDLPAYLRDDDE